MFHSKLSRVGALTLALAVALVPARSDAIAPALLFLVKQIAQNVAQSMLKDALLSGLSGMGCNGIALANALEALDLRRGVGGAGGMLGMMGGARMMPGVALGGVIPAEVAAKMGALMPGIGTTALLRIPYSFAGSLNIFPSLQACSSCFGAVQASVGVDGMADQFSFLGASSQGTINNPTFFLGGVARSGVLEGRVPVNTELYLRGSLVTQVHCQSNIALSCGTEALFGGTLTYNGFSPDAVDFVWGLTPTAAVAAVPEPTTWLLFGVGVLGLVGRCATGRRRR